MKPQFKQNDIIELLNDCILHTNSEYPHDLKLKQGARYRVLNVHIMKHCEYTDQLEIVINSSETAFILSYHVFLFNRRPSTNFLTLNKTKWKKKKK